jgi:hypothetical protein
MEYPGLGRRRQMQTLGELVATHNAGRFAHWRHNRDVDDRRARAIADHYTANGFNAGPQPIIIGILPSGATYLMDGQHRLRAGALLLGEARNVEVEVVHEPCVDDDALRGLFRLINIGTPVPAQYYNEELARFIAETAALIKARWPRAYSGSPGAPRPWFSDQSLAHNLGGAWCREAIVRGAMGPQAFVEELAVVCREVEDDFRNSPDAASRRYATTRAPTVFSRALERGFCAGVMVEWGDYVAGRLTAQ